MGACNGDIPIGVPADRDLPDNAAATGQPVRLTRGMPLVHKLSVGFHRDQMIGEHAEFVDRLLPAHRHSDADGHIWQVPQPRGIHLVVVAPPIDQAATE